MSDRARTKSNNNSIKRRRKKRKGNYKRFSFVFLIFSLIKRKIAIIIIIKNIIKIKKKKKDQCTKRNAHHADWESAIEPIRRPGNQNEENASNNMNTHGNKKLLKEKMILLSSST